MSDQDHDAAIAASKARAHAAIEACRAALVAEETALHVAGDHRGASWLGDTASLLRLRARRIELTPAQATKEEA